MLMCVQVPTEARTGYLIIRSWSYRAFCVVQCRCWDLNSGPHDCVASSPDHWIVSSSAIPSPSSLNICIYYLTVSYICIYTYM